LSGDVCNDPEGWSNKPCTSGVVSVQWLLLRSDQQVRAVHDETRT
jgi:hypothetical protein